MNFLKKSNRVKVIFKDDKPIAEILPINKKKYGWKRQVEKVKPSGDLSTSKIIAEERDK